MYEELINKEKKQLRLFYKFKKAGVLCLILGGIVTFLSIVEIIIFAYVGNFDLSVLAELQLVPAVIALELGLPATIIFSIFVNKKEKNIIELRKQQNETKKEI